MPELLIAEKRTKTGKGHNRRLRSSGKLPAVVYGKGIEPLVVAVDPKALLAAMSGDFGQNAVFDIDIQEGGKSLEHQTALLRDYQVNPLKSTFVHADFVAIDMNTPVTIRVPLEITGRALGVVEGGIIQLIRRDVGISCLPAKIPARLAVDISELNIGDSIHVSEVQLPEGATVTDSPTWTIIACVAPEAEKVEEPLEGALPEGEEGEAAPAEGEKKEGAAPAEGATS